MLTFVAQKDYRTNGELVITMDDFGMGSTIVPDDVQIVVGDETAPRGVDQDSGASTVTLNVPNPGIDEGQSVVVTFFESAGITNPSDPGTYSWEVDDDESAEHASLMVTEDDVTDPERPPGAPGIPMFTPVSDDPGENTRYEIAFKAPTAFDGGLDELTIELEDFGFPSTIERSSVSVAVECIEEVIEAGEPTQCKDDTDAITTYDPAFNPEDVSISGEKVVITIGAINPNNNDMAVGISMGDMVKVVLRKSAGISNPTEAEPAKYVAVVKGFDDDLTSDALPIPLIVELDEDDGGRGKAVEATGKGFKNGTTVTFWLDANEDGKKDGIETLLCSAEADGDDIATCGFTITNPPFMPGAGNIINGIDGEGRKADEDHTHDFELKGSFTATPEGGSPGDTMLIQLRDFGANASVTRATLAGTDICNGDGQPACGNTLTIPNDTELGSLALKIWSGDENSTKNVDITGPTITVTPTELVANQRVSLSGSGYTARSTIEVITIGSDDFDGFERTADDTTTNVTVDSSGRWSTSVNVPLVGGTVNGGSQTLRVTDAHGRSGTVDVTIKEPTVTIDPASGRVGTTVTIRGRNFPSTNDTSTPFNVSISYENSRTISATPNAGGSFDEQMDVPNTAIPGQSHNITVRIEEGADQLRTITEIHMVPAGELELSADSGVPGSTIKVNGIGFKSFTQVTKATIGGTEVTPGRRPSTDGQGDFSFDILIPGLGIGVQTIEVALGTTTASIGFSVTASGVSSGNTTPVADAVTALGTNFVRSFHFNNDTKTWTFYDPEAGDASTQENFIADETYWILVMENVDGVILNNKSRNLTCVGGNCWNQIVW